jgi:DNA-binding transcriptional MerR regulator
MILRISEASSLLGVSVSTLRRYDRQGIFKARRGPSNHRLYDVDDLKKIEHEILRKGGNENE